MKAEHTQGPWVFRVELGTVNAVDPMHSQDGRARIEICDPSNGQTWNGGALPIDEREANAHLIAAAPDLLAILEVILGAHDTKNNGAYMGEAVLCHHYAETARAAIAKARGEA